MKREGKKETAPKRTGIVIPMYLFKENKYCKSHKFTVQ